MRFPFSCPAGDCGFAKTPPFGPTPVTITNAGPGSLTINSVALSGPDAHAFTAQGCAGTTIAAGSSCQIAVSFDTKTQGGGDGKGNYTADLTITDNAETSPQTVQLTSYFPPPTVSLSPNPLTFPPDTVTVSNSGAGADLLITDVAISGPSAADFSIANNTCGSSLPAGNSCTIQVRFSRRGGAPFCQAGSNSSFCAAITISDNADSGQQQVGLVVSLLG